MLAKNRNAKLKKKKKEEADVRKDQQVFLNAHFSVGVFELVGSERGSVLFRLFYMNCLQRTFSLSRIPSGFNF